MSQILIDTTDRKETKVEIVLDKKKDRISEDSLPKSQNTLILIDKILKRNKLKPRDIEEVSVNVGPGSFTGTRVGVAIANAFGFALGIKINKKKSVIPKYN